MKKGIFLLLAFAIIFALVFMVMAKQTNEAVRNRDGPVFIITADIQPEVIRIAITKVSIVVPTSAPMGVWAQIARTENNLSLTRLVITNTVASVRLPFTIVPTDVNLRPMKLPILQDSGRKSLTTNVNCGQNRYPLRV